MGTYQVKKHAAVALLSIFLTSCASSEPGQARVSVAEAFIDAFYSFDRSTLEPFLVSAQSSAPQILYYQGWVEGGNYEIIERKSCKEITPGVVSCAITVKDDPMLALGIDFNVTDTFNITLADNVITSVETTANDLQVYHDARAWVMKELPELIAEPCLGFFDGGPTPANCARAMTKGYARFAASKDFPATSEVAN